MWKQAWWLVGKELKYQWQAFLATMIATFVISLAATTVLIPVVSDADFLKNGETFNRFMIDFIFIGIAPSFAAIFMAGPYLSFKSIKEDPFSKRMAVYRALPVPITVIARSRILLMLVTLLTMSAVFYTSIIAFIANTSGTFLSKESIVMMIMFWFGYALFAGSINIFIEFGTNGKMLWIYPFVYVLFIILMMIFVYKLKGTGIAEWIMNVVQNHGWWVPIASIVLGAISCSGMAQLLKSRLNYKDYI